jgi:hypothetical protein
LLPTPDQILSDLLGGHKSFLPIGPALPNALSIVLLARQRFPELGVLLIYIFNLPGHEL